MSPPIGPGETHDDPDHCPLAPLLDRLFVESDAATSPAAAAMSREEPSA
jgi:hypothetical protein